MLIEFSVENFRSFKERVTFSMEANPAVKTHSDNVVQVLGGRYSLLKSAVIYGANASGKSNFLLALDCLKNIVRFSQHLPLGEKIVGYDPYLFSKESEFLPVSFDISFLCFEAVYRYKLKFRENKILLESLSLIDAEGEDLLLYERIEERLEIHFMDESDKETQLKKHYLQKELLSNQLLLSYTPIRNLEELVKPYQWFIKNLKQVLDDPEDESRTAKKALKNTQFRNLTTEASKRADFSIDSLDYRQEQDVVIGNTRFLNFTRVIPYHLDEDGKPKALPYENESQGTMRFQFLLGHFYDPLKYGQTLLCDEIDQHLHSKLCIQLIDLFSNPDVNRHQAQLIFTTHNTGLLNNVQFRPDQIWFAEKTGNPSHSQLFSLDQFADLQEDGSFDLAEAYMEGRFGGIPDVDSSLALPFLKAFEADQAHG